MVLDAAIASMEKAMKIAEVDKNKALKIWVYSNIADFYGHAGRIEDSYKYYLKTLNVDPNNTYALKGIAWIAFSYERNPEQALEIISAIETKKAMPDLYLLKAEIAAFQKNDLEEEKALYAYNEMLAVHNYGEMYNSYNVLLLAEKPRAVEDAIKIAQLEVQNRPTPESYDLLAWSYFKSGDKEKALEIIQMHTLGKSFEPSIVYHAAEILKANAKYSDITPMKEELLASIYELGPGLEEQINSL
jgi:tetratricopeptide (TPR) repeat protein